jgi:hypothetical protein
VVSFIDAGGNVVESASASVTLTTSSGAGTLAGTATVAAVAGVATFSGLSIGIAGQYNLSASFRQLMLQAMQLLWGL